MYACKTNQKNETNFEPTHNKHCPSKILPLFMLAQRNSIFEDPQTSDGLTKSLGVAEAYTNTQCPSFDYHKNPSIPFEPKNKFRFIVTPSEG